MRWLCAAAVVLLTAHPAIGQQRPLLTEDPEPIGAGRVLIEGGFDMSRAQQFPASGLEGNMLRAPSLGLSVGLGPFAELQIDGAFYRRLTIRERVPAPLSHLLTVTGTETSDVDDFSIGAKIRLIPENAERPAVTFRFATRLPNASNESGLGLDTTDFFASLLAAKTVQSIRVVGNLGLGILADPTVGYRQNDVLTYGLSLARALTDRAEVVTELNGRISAKDDPYPGTESRGILTVGGRYTQGMMRFDGAIFFGTTSRDPTVGFTLGMTYVFNALTTP